MPEKKNNIFGDLQPIRGREGRDYTLTTPLQQYSGEKDAYYRPEYNQEWNRASNQGWADQLANGLISRGLSIIPKIGNGIGPLYGAIAGDELEDVWNNSINEAFNNMDEGLRETFPVYRSMKYDTSGLLGKLTTTGFWANDAFDGVAFALSAAVPGGLIGWAGKGLAGGAKALSTTQLAKNLGLTLKGLEKTGKGAQLLTATAYNTLAESSVEAYQTQKDLEALYESQGIEPEVAKQKAAVAAARTFRANIGILAVPNLVENVLFHGGIGDLTKKVRGSLWANEGKLGADLKLTDSLWSKVGTGLASEGFWEENAQTSVSQYERMLATAGVDAPDGYVGEVLTNMGLNMMGFAKGLIGADESPEEVEGAVSIFLGGLIGSGMGAYSYARERKQAEKLVEGEKKRYEELFARLGPAAAGLYHNNVNSLYKNKGKKKVKVGETDIEINDLELDEAGNPIVNPQALVNRSVNSLKDKTLWDATMLAAYRNDPTMGELAKEAALSSYAYALKSSGYEYTNEEIDQYLDKLGERLSGVAELEKDVQAIQENLDKVKTYVKQLDSITSKRSSIKDNLDNPALGKFNEFLNKTEFYLQSKLVALNNLLPQATTEQGKATITALIEDTTKYLEQINTETDAIKKQYDETIAEPANLAMQYKSLLDNKTRTPEETEEMNKLWYLLNEYQYINGAWINKESSRTLPGGAELYQLDQTSLGTRDMYNRELGRTTLALAKIKEGLEADPKNILAAATEFIRNVSVKDETNVVEVEDVQNTIVDTLESTLTPLVERAEQIQEAVTELENLSEKNTYAEPTNTIEEFLDAEALNPDLAKQMLLAQGVDLATPYDSTEFDKLLVATVDPLLKEFTTLNEQGAPLAQAQELMGTQPILSQTQPRLNAFALAENKESFLKEDYYKTTISEPIKELIKLFESNPDDFIDDIGFQKAVTALRNVITAYETRKDLNNPSSVLPDAKALLKKLETEIAPVLNANLNKLAERHRIANNNVTVTASLALGITVADFKNKENKEARAILEEILGNDKNDKSKLEAVGKLIASNEVLSMDGLTTLLEFVRNNATPEQLESLIKAIKAHTDAAQSVFVNNLKIEGLKEQPGPNKRKLTNQLYFQVRFLINRYYEGKDVPDIARKYLFDWDIESLDTAVKNSNLPEADKQFLRSIHKVFYATLGSNVVLDGLQSKTPFAKLTEAKSGLEGNKPSLQQNIVLNQAMQFITSKHTATAYDNWFIVPGIGGSGKTFLIANLLPQLYNDTFGKPLNVYAFSSNQRTTDNINVAVFNEKRNASLSHFLSLSAEELAKIDVVIIDEVFTFTNEEIAMIQNKVSTKELPGSGINIIALGDPSQATAEEEISILNEINVKISFPLTTSYRTSVNEIANFTSKFQLRASPVNSATATLNMELEELATNPAKAFGVASVTLEQLEQTLAVPSTRSRVLIVGSRTDKEGLKNRFPGVEVVTINEAQGYQWDEVYTYIDTTIFGEDPLKVNRMLYTAYSRAKSLLVIAGSNVVQGQPSTNMEATIRNAAQQMEEAANMYSNNLKAAKDVKTVLDGVSMFTAEDNAEVSPEDVETPKTDENIVSDISYADVQEPEPTTFVNEPVASNGSFFLSFPTNAVLRSPSGDTKHVALNSEAHIIRTHDRTKDLDSYYVIAPSAAMPGQYVIIGILGNEDFEGPAKQFFGNVLKAKAALTLDTAQIKGLQQFPLTKEGAESMSLGRILVKDYVTFRTITSPTFVSDSSSYMPGAKDVIEDAVIRFYLNYYGVGANGAGLRETLDPSKKWVSSELVDGVTRYTVNWNNIGKNIEFRIATRATPLPKGFLGKQLPGVPYLIVKPKTVDKHGNETPLEKKPMVIPFQPQVFNRSHRYFQEIRAVLDATKVIEANSPLKLGTSEFADVVRRYKDANFRLQQKNVATKTNRPIYEMVLAEEITPASAFPEFANSTNLEEIDAALQVLVNKLFAPELRIKTFATREDAERFIEESEGSIPKDNPEHKNINGQRVIDIKETKAGKFMLVTSKDVEGTDTGIYKEHAIREGHGSAQVAYNSLAQANNVLNYGDGSFQFIRKVLKDYSEEETKRINIVKAESILEAGVRYTDYQSFYENKIVQEILGENAYNSSSRKFDELVDLLTAGIDTLSDERKAELGVDNSKEYARRFISLYTTKRVTSERLELLVGDAFYDENGDHIAPQQQLRTPLQMHTLQKGGINDLGANLSDPDSRATLSTKVRHNFVGFTTTAVEFGLLDEVVDVAPPITPEFKKTGELLKTIIPSDDTDLNTIVDLLRSIDKKFTDVDIVHYPNGIPVAQPDGSIKYEKGTKNKGAYAVMQRADGTWVLATTIKFDNINSDRSQLIGFLHEMLHLISRPAIEQGMRDYKAKIDTPEARLYNQMRSIKKRFDSAIRSKRGPDGKKLTTRDVYAPTASKLDIFEFVANLSNPRFIQLAKEIQLLPQTRGPKKSVMRLVLEAILDFFKALGIKGLADATTYDATLTSLQSYWDLLQAEPTYATTKETTPKVVKQSANKLSQDLLKDVTKSLSVENESIFEQNLDWAQQFLSHVIDIDSLPEGHNFTFELELTRNFKKLPEEEKIRILQEISIYKSKLSFAYHNPEAHTTIATKGGIYTTRATINAINKTVFAGVEKRELLNLVDTLILKDIENSGLIERLIAAKNNNEALKDIFYSEIFSNLDKTEFMKLLGTARHDATATTLFGTDNEVLADIKTAINLLETNQEQLKSILHISKDRNVFRYKAAHKFVTGLIEENLNKDKRLVDSTDPEAAQNLIRTRREVLNGIEAIAKDPNVFLPNGRTKSATQDYINQLYAEALSVKDSNILRYNDLIFKVIPALEDELAGIEALSASDTNGKKIAPKVIADIYPKFKLADEETIEKELEFLEMADAEYSNKDRTDKELDDVANIAEYLKEYNKSYELTLSESLKDFLNNIYVGEYKISGGLAYIKTLEFAIQLDWSNGLDNVLSQVTKMLASQTLSPTNIAVLNNLRTFLATAISNTFTDGVAIPSNYGITTTTSPAGVTFYYAYHMDDPTMNISLPTYEQLVANNIERHLGNTTAELYEWLKERNPSLTVKQFNRMYTKADTVNAVRGIMNNMASMKETDLYIASRKLQKGSIFRFYRSKSSGLSFNIKEAIIYNLQLLYEDNNLHKLADTFLSSRYKALAESADAQDKIKFVKEFVAALGFPESVEDLNIVDAEVTGYKDAIVGLLNTITKDLEPFNEDLNEVAVADEESKLMDFHDWVEEHTDTRLNKFSQLLAKSDNLYRNPSVRNHKGDKFYKFHESSWAYDTINKILLGQPLPEHLSTAEGIPTFYGNNPFITGKSKIHAIGEYDGALNEENRSSTPYIRENLFFFYHRKFLQGFLDGLRQYGSGKTNPSYYQFTYIPSDKPKHPLMRTSLIEDGQVKEYIQMALQQILDKQTYGSQIEVANYQKSIEEDLFRNFELAEEALRQTNLEFNAVNIPTLADKIYDLMGLEAERILEELLSEDVQLTFDKRTYTRIKKLQGRLNPKYELPTDKLGSKKQKVKSFKSKEKNKYSVKASEIIPIFDLFFKNNYLNGYFMNQIIAGDYAAYKNNSADIVKRYAGVFGPGIKPLVDPLVGSKPTYNTLVLADTVVTKDELRASMIKLLYDNKEPEDTTELDNLMSFFSKSFEYTDAQGFMLPKRYLDLTRGFEVSWGFGQVHKPIHFEIQNHDVRDENGNLLYRTAIPKYIKYSSVVLSDELVDKFPILKRFRANLELLGADEVVFNSAVKEGAPISRDENGEVKTLSFAELVALDEEGVRNIKNNWKAKPMMELSNHNYRLQHNPAYDPNKGVSLFTQLIYFLNVYPDKLASGEFNTTQDAAQRTYEIIGELIKMGREKFEQELKNKGLKGYLLTKFDGPGAERALEMLQQGISVDHPLIEKKATIALASGLEKATVKIKFPGGKLVLQTSEGINLYQDEDTFTDLDTDTSKQLQYKREDVNGQRIMVAEVIVPREMLTSEQLEALARKESIYLLPDMVGFRIPSTELHSAVPMRVVGVYSNKFSNVIIAPKELVPIHGSDFDVDALFVVNKELFNEKETSIISAEYVQQYTAALRSTIDQLHKAEEELDDVDSINALRKLSKDIKKIAGLSTVAETPEVDRLTIKQNKEYEAEFNKFINTPQQSFLTKRLVIRSQLQDFNEDRARKEWGNSKGLLWIPADNQWVLKNTLPAKAEQIRLRIEDRLGDFPQLAPIATSLMEIYATMQDMRAQQDILGQLSSAVGYVKKSGKYVFDESFLKTIEDKTKALKEIEANLPSELAPIKQQVKQEIKKLTGLKEKFLKNWISNTILTVISDDNNKFRMTNAISFIPLKDAISTINPNLIPSERKDLSNVSHEFEVFNSLSSGAILVGAFANAAKSFAYFARAGASPELQKFYDVYGTIRTHRKLLEAKLESTEDLDVLIPSLGADLIKLGASTEEINTILESNAGHLGKLKALSKVIKASVVQVSRLNRNKINTSPVLNSRYKFSIVIDDKQADFDRLRMMDARGDYNITQVLDTLTNAAIDNLKEGLLVQGRINVRTGSALVGMVSLGVPLDVALKILYQPILAPLAQNKVRNTEDWIKKVRASFYNELQNLSPLTEDELNNGQTIVGPILSPISSRTKGPYFKASNNLRAAELEAQLKAFDIFAKAYRVGEDMRNAATFLDLIRSHDVFVEDIFQLEDNLHNKIGVPTEVNNELVLATNLDFAFPIPNLFETAPHVKEAYKVHLSVVDMLKSNFKIHSQEAISFSEDVAIQLPETPRYGAAGEVLNKQAQLAGIRRSLSYYLLSHLAANEVTTTPKIIRIGKNKTPYTLSKLRSFSNEVAERLWKIKQLSAELGQENLFLKHVAVVRDSNSVSNISFKSGVNLDPATLQEMALGFKKLNSFSFAEDNTPSHNPDVIPQQITQFQQDLLYYAILNYGLQYSTSNYSSFISPELLKVIDDQYNNRLSELISTPEERARIQSHFMLSHIMQNAKDLKFVPFELVQPALARTEDANAVYAGKQGDIYYDLAVSLTKEDEDGKFDAPTFIKDGFGKKMRVFVRVATDDNRAYYQKVGSIRDAFHLQYNGKIPYNPTEYFHPKEASIEYHYITDDTAYTYSGMIKSLNPGDTIWIYPNYNFDRTLRKKVQVVSLSTFSSNVAPGYTIKYKEVETEPKLVSRLDQKVNDMLEDGTITKNCE